MSILNATVQNDQFPNETKAKKETQYQNRFGSIDIENKNGFGEEEKELASDDQKIYLTIDGLVSPGKMKKIHRDKNIKVFAMSVKANIGLTMLVLPSYFQHTGWAIGIASLVLVALIISFAALVIAEVAKTFTVRSDWNTLSELFVNYSRKRLKFVERNKNALENTINLFLLLNQLAVCSAFAHLGANHFYTVFPNINGKFFFYFLALIILIGHFLALLCANNFEKQGNIALISMIFGIVSLGMVSYVVCKDFSWHPTVKSVIFSKMVLFSLTGFVFAFESLTMIVPVLKTAPDIDSGAKYYILALFICCIIYSIIATIFYGKFGENIAVILFHSVEGLFSRIASHIYVISVQLGFGIQYLLAHEILDSFLKTKTTKYLEFEAKFHSYGPKNIYAMKMLLMFTVIYSITVLVPHFDALLSLIGASFGLFFSLHLPLFLMIIGIYEKGKKEGFTARIWAEFIGACLFLVVGLLIMLNSVIGCIERLQMEFA